MLLHSVNGTILLRQRPLNFPNCDKALVNLLTNGNTASHRYAHMPYHERHCMVACRQLRNSGKKTDWVRCNCNGVVLLFCSERVGYSDINNERYTSKLLQPSVHGNSFIRHHPEKAVA
eukprot:gb/GECG01001816.1/.p1 GENE.gb/GECG01001816.1/~~gb/GECG01001816.1/.p1  ORF type:complete len:118 (+),score=6.92 gb/GECG01001816.1/:1-354(+)